MLTGHIGTIHLSDRTDRGVNYTVTIQEIHVIFSAFQTLIFLTGCQQFQFVDNIDLKMLNFLAKINTDKVFKSFPMII